MLRAHESFRAHPAAASSEISRQVSKRQDAESRGRGCVVDGELLAQAELSRCCVGVLTRPVLNCFLELPNVEPQALVCGRTCCPLDFCQSPLPWCCLRARCRVACDSTPTERKGNGTLMECMHPHRGTGGALHGPPRTWRRWRSTAACCRPRLASLQSKVCAPNPLDLQPVPGLSGDGGRRHCACAVMAAASPAWPFPSRARSAWLHRLGERVLERSSLAAAATRPILSQLRVFRLRRLRRQMGRKRVSDAVFPTQCRLSVGQIQTRLASKQPCQHPTQAARKRPGQAAVDPRPP